MAGVKGLIGVIGAELGRYAVFYDSLLHLATPPGTALVQTRGGNVAENRNIVTREALRLGAEWVLYLDDDHVLAPDTLMRLLAHGVDIVSGLYVKREIPFVPCVYDEENEAGLCRPRLLAPGDCGRVKVKAVGAGCLLVRRRVIETLGDPCWRIGGISSDVPGEDIQFCKDARAAFFTVWCDLDTVVGHQMMGTVWPQRGPDGSWKTTMLQRDEIASWPAAALNHAALDGVPV